jgi:hypothetical protein
MNTNNNKLIEIDGTAVDNVKHFIYLGTTVCETGGTNKDIRRRLSHARLAVKLLSFVNTILFTEDLIMRQEDIMAKIHM